MKIAVLSLYVVAAVVDRFVLGDAMTEQPTYQRHPEAGDQQPVEA